MNNRQQNVSFRADVRIPMRKQELVFELGKHVEDAFQRDLPEMKKHGDGSYIYTFYREYSSFPKKNSKNVLTHLSDDIRMVAYKRNGIFGLEESPSVLIEGAVKFLDAAKQAKELLDAKLLRKKGKVGTEYLD